MARKSKITDQQYSTYLEMISRGSTKAAACRFIGVNSSTMHDYDKAQKKFKKPISEKPIENKKIHYTCVVNENSFIFAFSDNVIHINKNSNEFLENTNFYISLLTNPDFTITQEEYSKYFDSKMNSDCRNVKHKFEAHTNELTEQNSEFMYKGVKLPSKLMKLISNNVSSAIKFADLLIKNPDQRIIDQLYGFLLHNDITICDNGYVLTYKAVNSYMKDIHTNSIDNNVGETVEMDRSKVDNDPNRTCSFGLHVGSLSYITDIYSAYTSIHIVKCIVSPENFVSIPADYNFAKARVCKYKVVGLHTEK